MSTFTITVYYLGKEVTYVLSYLLENPALAICIVVAVLIIAKAFKVSMKLMKWLLIGGIIYVAINFLHLI